MRALFLLLFALPVYAVELTSIYEGHEPFHETLYEPYPEEVCKSIRRGREKKCTFVINAKPNPDKFRELLTRKLLEQYPREVVGRYFSLIAKLPASDQTKVLNRLVSAKEVEALTPSVLSAALRIHLNGNEADLAKLDDLTHELGISRGIDAKIKDEYFQQEPLSYFILGLKVSERRDIQQAIQYLESRGLAPDAIKSRVLEKLQQCRVLR